MTPKEKAAQLINKFAGLVDTEISGEHGFHFDLATKEKNMRTCALIVAQEARCAATEDRDKNYYSNVIRAIGDMENISHGVHSEFIDPLQKEIDDLKDRVLSLELHTGKVVRAQSLPPYPFT